MRKRCVDVFDVFTRAAVLRYARLHLNNWCSIDISYDR